MTAPQSLPKPQVNHGFLTRISFIAALGGVLYGYDMGIIAAAIIFVRHSFALSTLMEELVVSIVLVGAMAGAMVGGAVADRIGRRATLVWAGGIFILGSLLAPLAPNVGVLIVARAIIGIAIGFTSVTAPVYVSELAPPQSRGMLIGLYQFALTLGIALADLVGYWLATQQAWRLMFGLAVVPTLFLSGGDSDSARKSALAVCACQRERCGEGAAQLYGRERRATISCRHSGRPEDANGAKLEIAVDASGSRIVVHRRGNDGAAASHGDQYHYLLRAADF